MNTFVLIAIFASLVTAPALAFALDDSAPAPAAARPMAASPVVAESATAATANLRFVVHHTGLDAPAILTLEGADTTFVHAVVIEDGENTLLDGAHTLGTYRITLQNVMTMGSMSVELADCRGRTMLASMNTTFELTRFGISVGPEECIDGQA